MRTPSRHMPQYKPRPIGLAGWVILAALVWTVIHFAVSKPVIAALTLLGFGLLFALPTGRRQEQRLRDLAASREGQSICEFAREFDLRVVDTWVVRAVYEQLQRQLEHIHPAFPLRADDRLREDLLLEDDDLDMEVAQEVEQRTGRSLNDTGANPYHGKVRTIRDLVFFFQAQARRGAA